MTRDASYVDAHFLRWLLNTIVVAGVDGAPDGDAGRARCLRVQPLPVHGPPVRDALLLLIQMFPQLLLVVAIYLIVLNVGGIFPVMGLNTYTALIVVYLGGSLGVNAWLMKGFFDTIPTELDESARVDGATPAQVFWGVVLPLAAPVLVVVGLISFISR